MYYSKLCVAEENIKKLQAHPERVNFITADTSSSKVNKTGKGQEGYLPYQFVLNNEKLNCCRYFAYIISKNSYRKSINVKCRIHNSILFTLIPKIHKIFLAL